MAALTPQQLRLQMWKKGQKKPSCFQLEGIMLLTGHLAYPASVHVPGLLVVFKLFENAYLKRVVMRSG